MDKKIKISYTVYLILICLNYVVCSKQEKSSNLVQPESWWTVHPRPIYSALEKVDTFQDWFDVYLLNEDTYALYEPNQFEEALSYLVVGKERAALIDTGTGIGNIKQVVEELTDLPVTVILTHEHYDHVAAAYRFEEVIMYDDAESLKVLKAGRSNSSLQKYVKEDYLWKPLPENFNPDTWIIPSMEPTKVVREGDLIDLGERELEVIYTPGHSPGSMCLFDKNNRILFTGDHFFAGPLYAHALDVVIDDYIKSNKKLVEQIQKFDYICGGHNDPWVGSEVLSRVSQAFDTIFNGEGNYSENQGLRRYYFEGFDVLVKSNEVVSRINNKF